MTRPPVWYEAQDSGIELSELWDLLARHGYVTGLLSGVDTETLNRIEAFAADLRIEELRRTPAAVRFLSCEPLLEDLGTLDLTGIDWVIAGAAKCRCRCSMACSMRSSRGEPIGCGRAGSARGRGCDIQW